MIVGEMFLKICKCLKIIEGSIDGFVIVEVDFKLCGFGEICGIW